jgi:RNA polymerase sigma-70 factor (ECF subfamily)
MWTGMVLLHEEDVSAHQDEADVKRVLAGDLSAFEGIVQRWQGPLVNLAYRFCRDRGRAEEMAQEAFLRAYRGLSGWRREASFSTWLIALATNHYRSAFRANPLGLVTLDLAAQLVSSASGVDAMLQSRHRDETVRAAVLALPAKYRDALTLYYFHEMDVAAAAGSLGVPEGTVKARLLRGRELLRAKLTQTLSGLRLEEVR